MEHESVCHRRIWRCFAAEHQGQDYKSLEMLKAHIREEHKDLTTRQILTVLPFLAKTVRDDRTVCPFCGLAGPFENGLSDHMAAHQERLARFAIPRFKYAARPADVASNGPHRDDKSTASAARRRPARRIIHRPRNSLDAAVCDRLERMWRDE
ncbi:hypothetical protein BJY00DRAFT_47607 [Aspergillus carlsbadensis]|nr:hypothetical protein BJY00DRAFT_47607 [Aspergillus carlsbadensis]